jgi:serine/threonine protein kinase
MRMASPSQVGAYRIERLLGRGGMGEVFLAWDERLERHVAIKRIRSDKPIDSRRRARFRREARAIARLSHPVIADRPAHAVTAAELAVTARDSDIEYLDVSVPLAADGAYSAREHEGAALDRAAHCDRPMM